MFYTTCMEAIVGINIFTTRHGRSTTQPENSWLPRHKGDYSSTDSSAIFPFLRKESNMSNITSNQLVLSSGSSQTSDNQLAQINTNSQPRIRTNIYPLSSIDIFVPEENESVPYTFMLSMHKIRTAEGSEEKLLSGYFSALCAVLPDLTKLAYELLKNLGFEVMEMKVSSEFDINYTKIPRFDNIIEVLSFAQLIYIPFACYSNRIGEFWSTVARNAGIQLPIYLVRESDVKTLHSALKLSGLRENLRSELYRSQQALSATSTPFGVIFSEANNSVRSEARNSSSGCRA